jgi:hypothetical protein
MVSRRDEIGLPSRIMDAPPFGLGQLRQQTHEELRQRRRLKGMSTAVGGMPMHHPAFPTTAALDLEASGPMLADEAQPADEQHRGETVALPTSDGELARDLRVEVVRIVWQRIYLAHLCGYMRRRSLWQDRGSR